MFGNDRSALRRQFSSAWQKFLARQPLSPLEDQLIAVIQKHPEYHPILEDIDSGLEREFRTEQGETNPFLHLALHLAVAEQVATDRPGGIRQLYQTLSGAQQDSHRLEHQIMDCLADQLWLAQQQQHAPDETRYLECLQRLLQQNKTSH
jgi:hypothetical protein